MKKAIAQTFLEILCDCPYCKESIDVTNDLKDHLEDDLRATSIDVEVTCTECGKEFVIADITY